VSLGIGGAAFLRNLPAAGAYQVNEPIFNTETERNDVPLQPVTWTGLGGAAMDVRVPNNGILANVRVSLEATMALGGTSPVFTPGYQWPWNLIKKLTFNANGQTSLISAEGIDLRARRQRLYRNPIDPVSKAPSIDSVGNSTGAAVSAASSPISLQWDLPITHDEATLVGALFAQSDQNYLSVKIAPAQLSDLGVLTGTTPTMTITGTVRLTVTFFDIPLVAVQGRDQVIIPNLAWLHGYLSGDFNFANTGDVRAPFIRTAGQLLAYMFVVDNGGQATINPLALNEARFTYGGNRKPRVYNPVSHLIEKNARDYNGGILPVGGAPTFTVFDFEGDNPQRDLVYPKGVSELAVEVNIATGTGINSNARIHFCEDTLFAGR
jgi:hypothetical protein